jgi:outer membrane receptor protein involved in Fe transport
VKLNAPAVALVVLLVLAVSAKPLSAEGSSNLRCFELSLLTPEPLEQGQCTATVEFLQDEELSTETVEVSRGSIGGRFCVSEPAASRASSPSAASTVRIGCSLPIRLEGQAAAAPEVTLLLKDLRQSHGVDGDPSGGDPSGHYAEEILVSTEARAWSPTSRRILQEDAPLVPAGASVSSALDQQSSVVSLSSMGENDALWIRGAGSRLISTQIDGERIPSLLGGQRTAGLAITPVDLFDDVRLQTAFVASRDVDAIGGALDLRTSGPTSASSPLLRVSQGGGDLGRAPGTAVSVRDSRSWLDDRLWLNAGVSARSLLSRTDALETRFDLEPMEDPELENEDLRVHEHDRRRLAGLLAGKFSTADGGLQLGSQLFVSHGRTAELRRRTEFNYSEDFTQKELKEALNRDRLSSLRLSADGLVRRGILVSGTVLQLGADESQPVRTDTAFLGPLTDTAVGGGPAAGFFLEEVQVEDDFLSDRSRVGDLALVLSPPDILRGHDSSGIRLQELRFGVKARAKDRERDANSGIYTPFDDYALDLAVAGSPLSIFRGQRALGTLVAPAFGDGLIESGELSYQASLEEDGGDYTAEEDSSSAFAELVLAGSTGELAVGLRHERVKASYLGFEVVEQSGGSETRLQSLPGRRSFDAWVPTAHWVQSFGARFELTASASRSFSSPDYGDLVPYLLADFPDLELERGNADLVETTSWNFDLAGVWRGSSMRARVALFYKSLANPIVTSVTEELFLGETFEARMPVNAASGRLGGIDLELSKSFQLRGGGRLVLDWSAVLADSETRLDFRQASLPLAHQADAVAFLGVTLDLRRLHATAGGKYVGDSLWQIGADRQSDVWLTEQFRVHAGLRFDLTETMSLSLYLENLTDEGLDFRQGDKGLPWLQEQSGRRLSLGWTGRF